MSLTETPAATRARMRPWAEVLYLLTLTLTRDPFGDTPATLVLKLSDQPYRYPEPPDKADTANTPPTEQYVPLVIDWGQVSDALNAQDGGISVAMFDITVDNTHPIQGAARFSDLMRAGKNTAGYDFPFSPAILRQVFKGLADTDRTRLYRLVVEELTNVTDETCVLKMSGIELVLEDFSRLPIITTDIFPAAAPSAVGQAVPWLGGRCRNVPLYFTAGGLIDKLKDPITFANPISGGALQLSTPDIVERMPDSGTVQFRLKTVGAPAAADSAATTTVPVLGQNDLSGFQGSPAECVSYSGRDIPNARLLNIGRGARSTKSGDADAGTEVYQVLDEFVGIAGVNLGPKAARDLTAVYCDGMSKNADTPPAHTIEMENTTHWPGYSLNLVRFNAGATDLTPWAKCIEDAEIATTTDNCYDHDTINGPGWRTPDGTLCLRMGLDCPCGSPWQSWVNGFRFTIGSLPTSPGDAVVFRFWRGVYTGFGNNTLGQPPGYGVGKVFLGRVKSKAEDPTNGYDGPIDQGGGHTAVLSASLDTLSEPIMASGLFRDQFVYVDISTLYANAKAAGNTQMILLMYCDIVYTSPPPVLLLDGISIKRYSANWYAIGGDLAAPYAPALFLGAGSGFGSLLTRPNAGTASGSAAEAILGQVTVDILGPLDTGPDPFHGLIMDWAGYSGLGWDDSGDTGRAGHGPQIPLLPPVTCALGSAQGDNYCLWSLPSFPSFNQDWTTFAPSIAAFNAASPGSLFFDLLIDYTAGTTYVWLYEVGQAGMYRSMDNWPATSITFEFDISTSGQFTGAGPYTKTGDVDVEVCAMDDPLSLVDLQSNTHDTLAPQVVAILGTYSTGSAGPFTVDVTGFRFIVWRIKASSYPAPPAMGAVMKHYSYALVQNVTMA